jgi:RimJ/RimL family protein N-acetyltransferase
MNEVKRLIRGWKSNIYNETRYRISIRNQDGRLVGEMRCIDQGIFNHPEIIQSMVDWRQKSMEWFCTQFTATWQRTCSWLYNTYLPADDKILFLIYSMPDDELIGHYGIMNATDTSAETDNGLRGSPHGVKGIMTYAEIGMLAWMFGVMEMTDVNLWLFSHNELTWKWHLRSGYEHGGRIEKLRRITSPDTVSYVTDTDEGEPVDFRYMEMVITKKRLLEIHPWVKDVYPGNWEVGNE